MPGRRHVQTREPRTDPQLNRAVYLVILSDAHAHCHHPFLPQPQRFQPTFYESKSEGKRVAIVDEWCVGFLKGMRLDAAAWKPLKKERPELLKPIDLFGSRAGWKELKAGGDVIMHKKWSPKITPAVRAIHQFWMPSRVAPYAAAVGEVRH